MHTRQLLKAFNGSRNPVEYHFAHIALSCRLEYEQRRLRAWDVLSGGKRIVVAD